MHLSRQCRLSVSTVHLAAATDGPPHQSVGTATQQDRCPKYS